MWSERMEQRLQTQQYTAIISRGVMRVFAVTALVGVQATLAVAQSIDRAALPAELSTLTDEEVARIARMSPLPAVPGDPSNRFVDDETAARLGHRLFFDRRISPAAVTCADCHIPDKWFTDGKPLGDAIGTSSRNTPTVIDAARRRWVGWDGKFDSLWSQALAPIEHPDEMGSSRERLLRTVRDDATLRGMYERVFGPWPAALAAKDTDPIADEWKTAVDAGLHAAEVTAASSRRSARTSVDLSPAKRRSTGRSRRSRLARRSIRGISTRPRCVGSDSSYRAPGASSAIAARPSPTRSSTTLASRAPTARCPTTRPDSRRSTS
jgi:hypothetical protein